MVQAVLTGRLTGSGFSPAWFSSVSSECLCIIGLCKFVHGDVTVYVFLKILTFFILYLLASRVWWDCSLTWLVHHCVSVLWRCWVMMTH